ncbi:MAG: hypothetical protein L3J31_05365 [Bacteroidales bacterium]|nr:hypothetical protein [Bacteroidales bacterium]MCF6342217.1 hypothetical protein [Bacteroidales bacterium]
MGKNQTVKEFARQFDGLELLKRSNEGILLGDLYKKKATGKTRLEFSGYNIAFKIGLPGAGAKALKKSLQEVKVLDGAFADLAIKDSFSADAALSIPSVNVQLDGKVERSKVLGFEIGKIKTKVLRDALRLKIETAIGQLKAENPKKYRKKLKHLYLVEQLFYSESVQITIAKDTEVDVNAIIAESVGKVSVGVDINKNQVFTITGSGFPFAVDLKKVKDFI